MWWFATLVLFHAEAQRRKDAKVRYAHGLYAEAWRRGIEWRCEVVVEGLYGFQTSGFWEHVPEWGSSVVVPLAKMNAIRPSVFSLSERSYQLPLVYRLYPLEIPLPILGWWCSGRVFW